MTNKVGSHPSRGVSIITCTKRPQFINNVFTNYKNQRFVKKELIIILNRDDMDIGIWRERAKWFKNVSVYQLPEKTSLGNCLNFGITKTKYDFVAKFDDDDYYAPSYLPDSMPVFSRTNADIIGKRSHYTYLEGKKLLLIRFPNQEHKFVNMVHGATLIINKKVFDHIKFPDRSLGEDYMFLLACRKKGFKIYSTSRNHYVYLRRANHLHTWKPSEEYLLKTSKLHAYTNNYKRLMRVWNT